MLCQRAEDEERIFVAVPLQLASDLLRSELLHNGPVTHGVDRVFAVGSANQKRHGVFRFWKKRFEASPGNDSHIGIEHECCCTTICVVNQSEATYPGDAGLTAYRPREPVNGVLHVSTVGLDRWQAVVLPCRQSRMFSLTGRDGSTAQTWAM